VASKQRLCIARTVAVKPEVILFDEPCSALDPISTAKIEELIDELKADYTIVIVTHNMQQAARVSDFTAFMYLGELVEFSQLLHQGQKWCCSLPCRPPISGSRPEVEKASPGTDTVSEKALADIFWQPLQ